MPKKTSKKITKKTSAKKKTTKTTSSKKAVTKKNQTSISAGKTKLLDELRTIAVDLPDESIKFLLNQASVLRHNKLVDELRKQQTTSDLGTEKKNKTTAMHAKQPITIKEADDNSYFVININGYGSFFTLEEMRKLVKLCHKAANVADAASRIFTWLSKERSDVIRNNYIKGAKDTLLVELYNVLISRYSVKE